MSQIQISCPQCQSEIKLDEVLTQKISRQLSQDFKKKESMLELKQAEFLKQHKIKLDLEKKSLWLKAQQAAQEKSELEVKDLTSQLQESQKQIESAQAQELKFRKASRQLEEKRKSIDLEIEQRLDKELKQVQLKAKQEVLLEQQSKLQEKDHQLLQLQKTITELKRRSEQGSMQIQGDYQEEGLKQLLQTAFPLDLIEDVPTGVRGADLIQRVRSASGQLEGVILWESKNTKHWHNDWVRKLKEDQALVKADIAILATQVLPDKLEKFGSKDEVWVVQYQYVLALSKVLRLHVLQLARMKQSVIGTDQKMSQVYNYLSGVQFKNRIENIVLSFQGLLTDLDKEKRAFQRIWSKREQELDRVILNTSGLYGDLQGIIGNSLADIEALELPGSETGSEKEWPTESKLDL